MRHVLNLNLLNKLDNIVNGCGAICSDEQLDMLDAYLAEYDNIASIPNLNRIGTLDAYFVGRLDTPEIEHYRNYCSIS